jgi:hypothetical protein
MAFSTTSFLAGVGSVVVVLSTGFAGGYLIAGPDRNAPPNRLQRVADTKDAKAADTNAASTAKPQARPEIAAAVVTPAQAELASASATQSAAAQPPASATEQASTTQDAASSPAPQRTADILLIAHDVAEQDSAQPAEGKFNARRRDAERGQTKSLQQETHGNEETCRAATPAA